jgi:type VI protein secretion system component VasK
MRIEGCVADPGSGAFLPQGSGIRDDFFPDPGSLPRPKFKILPLKMAKNRKNLILFKI